MCLTSRPPGTGPERSRWPAAGRRRSGASRSPGNWRTDRPCDDGAVPISATHGLTAEAAINGPGQVVVLNGTSSSGKSTIAKELLEVLDGTWFHLAIDHFHRIRARRD